MVYRGRPSRSCRQCRNRDIKCDKMREACGQCTRANLLCPGYTDASAVIFTDETMSVLRKAGASAPPPIRAAPLPESCVEDRARRLFVSQYVFCKTGRFPFMDHFWHPQPQHVHLAMALRAVSLACMCIEFCCDDIRRRARQRYASAVYMTRAALQSPDSAMHNATLLTVLLLYLYEKLTGHLMYDSSGEWKHLAGALTLLQISGTSQFCDTTRLGLFRQLSMSIFLRCLRTGDDPPSALLELRQSARAVDRDGRLEDLMARFVGLRCSIRRGEAEECGIYGTVKQLDCALAQQYPRSRRWKFADAMAGDITDTELFIHLLETTSVWPTSSSHT